MHGVQSIADTLPAAACQFPFIAAVTAATDVTQR